MTPLLIAALACERLVSLSAASLPNATVTAAQAVTAGVFEQARDLPPFCRIAVTLKPSSDSDIKMEWWLPVAISNGKFQEVGNGAFNGSIAYPAMASALRRGYAAASTDTGHTGNTASFALGAQSLHAAVLAACDANDGVKDGGGEGPNSVDAIGALETWVERGTAPDQLIATRSTQGRIERTRPLCPYPQVAEYSGSGSANDAANFICRAR